MRSSQKILDDVIRRSTAVYGLGRKPHSGRSGLPGFFYHWASQTLSPDTCRRLMVQLNACLKWAIESKRVKLTRSPFDGMAGKAKKLIKKSEDEETDINPFTSTERDAIIEAFRTHPHYSHYYPYVYFCFYVGCQPSEAIALTWNEISEDFSQITFNSVIVAGEKGKQKCTIPINPYEGLKPFSKDSIARSISYNTY